MNDVVMRWKGAPTVEIGADAAGGYYLRHACVPREGWAVVTTPDWASWNHIPPEAINTPGRNLSIDIDLICGLCDLRGTVLGGKWVDVVHPAINKERY